ncbi:hypothetical protein JCM10207_005979 [Rhodosporidiobolus poonsookiae]
MAQFDKRTQGHPLPNDDRPSLKAFQQQVATAGVKGRAAAHPQRDGAAQNKAEGLAEAVEGLAIEDDAVHEVDDGRTVLDRITTPTDDNLAVLSALLDRTLDRRHGELVVALPRSTLSQSTFAALFDAPDLKAPLPAEDDPGLTAAQVATVVETFSRALEGHNAVATVLHNPFNDDGTLRKDEGVKLTETASAVNDDETERKWRGKALKLLVRRKPEGAEQLLETRVAVVGNVDAGKSSLLGVLTRGQLDDGRGKARSAVFRHKHELETGRTSSPGNEIMGYTPAGQVIMPGEHEKQQAAWEAIAAKAAKVISFIDLAGHERYLKTTLAGLTGTAPDFIMLIVGANAGLIGMSKEHLSVALALSLPVVVIITKVDMTPAPVYEQTVKQLVKILRSPGCRKTPVFVRDHGMSVSLAESFATEKACPIFRVSNLTGEGLPLLKTFLNVVRPSNTDLYPVNADFEFSCSEIYSVPFTGTVVSGVVLAGSVRPNDVVLLGPDSLNAFVQAPIKSIQRKRVNVDYAEAGQAITLALKRIKRAQVRKGMVLVAKGDVPPIATRRFEGQCLILYHSTLITPRYQAMMHVGSCRQTVQVEEILEKQSVRTGDRATLRFRFMKQSEYIHVGDRFLFREGRTKALGVVTKLLPNTKE